MQHHAPLEPFNDESDREPFNDDGDSGPVPASLIRICACQHHWPWLDVDLLGLATLLTLNQLDDPQ